MYVYTQIQLSLFSGVYRETSAEAIMTRTMFEQIFVKSLDDYLYPARIAGLG